MNAPKIDLTIETRDTDTDGKKWLTALTLPDGTILAGRDDLGNFQAFTDIENLYENAIAVLHWTLENGART